MAEVNALFEESRMTKGGEIPKDYWLSDAAHTGLLNEM